MVWCIDRVIESGSLDTKSSMTFITLTDRQLDGTPWDPKAQDQLCGRWTAVSERAPDVK